MVTFGWSWADLMAMPKDEINNCQMAQSVINEYKAEIIEQERAKHKR